VLSEDNRPARSPADVHEDARDVAHALAGTDTFEQIAPRTRKRVEMLFAHLKRILAARPFAVCVGPWRHRTSSQLAAIAQNLRRLAKIAAQPPPAAACVT